MSEILDGKKISDEVKSEVAAEIKDLGITPKLAVIVVGNNPASAIYVRNKSKACDAVGIESVEVKLPEDTSEDELLKVIDDLNADDSVDGILVQLPLPKQIQEDVVLNRISVYKDVDGFNPYNSGKLMQGNPIFVPCTPAGIMELLKRYNISVDGKNCVVVGRSNIVGKPIASLLLAENGTVTICHSHTKHLSNYTLNADIIVAAVGKSGFITPDMVKPGAVVIDVGINRDENGKVVGDVDPLVFEIASYMTPVPKGVGTMTIAMLLKNTLLAAKNKIKK